MAGARICVVTGAAAGIGRAVARHFADLGDWLVLNDLDADGLARVADDLEVRGDRCIVVAGDVSQANVAERLVSAAHGMADGRVDVLVNNVGDFRPAARDFLHSTPEQWNRLHEINLLHVLQLTHLVLPGMVERRSGSIVNVATVEAFRGIPANAVYSAYNSGVVAFTRSLAVEVGQHGVRVNAIAPDLIDTDQTPASLMTRGRDPEVQRTWVPLGRFGRPEDCARVVGFLASEDAGFVTGQTLPVDGGTLAASGWFARADGKGWTNMPDRP